MKLKKVEIYGFKSFPHRTEIVFNDGITGIVGPNGSGKSNISDAVRWVLGEQSAKTLRGTRMEDVIFSGTQRRKPMHYCEVSLLFDNADHALNSIFSEVMVTRRVYRSGDSEYYLNKSPCRLRDITDLFRDTGIGKDGYSLIGQGRIDEILSSKSDERRLVFEEAAGIVTYRVRKEEAEKKLAKARENLLRIDDILEEIALHLAPLEEQAEKAQEFLALSDRLRSHEINVFLIRHDRLRERMATTKALSDTLQAALAEQEEELNRLYQGQERSSCELNAIDIKLREARTAQGDANKQLFDAQRVLEQEKAKKEALLTEMTRHREATQDAERKLRELDALYQQGCGESGVQQTLLNEAEQRVQAEQAALDALISAADEAEKTLDAHKDDILTAMNRLNDVRTMQARQQAVLSQMEKQLVEVSENASALEADAAGLESALRDAGTTLKHTEADAAALADQRDRMDEELRLLRQDHQQRNEDMRSIAGAQRVAENRLSLLEEMSRDYEGYHQAVRRALSFAADDPEVFDVVAKLIRVPREYETAINMILGGTLQHIVTASEEAAKRMIDYLRENRLGRTTFLPLSAIRPRNLSVEERKLLSMPGCLGVASELVAYDAMFRNVMENILGRTVIADSLNTAIAISRAGKQAFNVVTLQGDVMRAGGAMTGGTAQGQSTSLLGREREAEELRTSLAQGAIRLATLNDEIKSLAAAIEQAEDKFNAADRLVQDARIAVARDNERLTRAQDELDAHLMRLGRTREAADQLEQAIHELRDDLAQAALASDSQAFDQEEMNEKTKALQRDLVLARERVEAQRGLAAARLAEYSEIEHRLRILTRDSARWDKEKAALANELEKSGKKADDLAEQLLRAENALEEQASICALGEAAVAEADNQVRLLDEARRAIAMAQQGYIGDTEKAHAAHRVGTEKLHKNELVLSRLENELQSLCSYIWDAYELTYEAAAQQQTDGAFDIASAEREIRQLKEQIRLLGSINVGAIEEHAQTRQRFNDLRLQRDDTLKAEQDLTDLIAQLLSGMEQQFSEEFEKLNRYFGETFSRLFGGGHAELRLADPSQPISCDIEIAAQPPGKKLQLLSLLSGGERALTAIAILFAMLKLKPTPFCILDEIEAALDDANITNFADYLSEYARSTQFIVITHRKGTMERCDALYGVSMEEKGVSSMISVNLQEYAV